jgi:protein CpxP
MERQSLLKRILVVALAIAGIGTLAAWKHGGHHGDLSAMVGARVDKVLDEVNATPDQRAKITAIRDRLVEKAKALHAGRKGDLQAALAQWDSPNPDRNAIHARIDQHAQATQAFAHEVADALVEVHGILTPDQRATLSKKWHQRLGQ